MTAPTRTFPPGFRFGAATAAYQIEGAVHEDGRRDSIWDAFCLVPGAILGGDTGEVACDHYHRYAEDVALMREIGLDSYRFSTSWARIRPDGGPVNRAGLDFYSRLVDELLGAGIAPWLTLYHWDLPQALQERGGWTVRDTADRFTEYALDVHDALGDRVDVWTTLNEPWCSSFLSYTAGVHAPGGTDVGDGMLAAHHLLLGHGQTVAELRRRAPETNLGITLNLTVAEAADPTDPADRDAARRIDGQFNRIFLEPIFRGSYPADVLADVAAVDAAALARFEAAVLPGDLATIAAPIDTLGVNYYHGEYVGGTAPTGAAEIRPHSVEGTTGRTTRSPFPAADEVYWRERGLPRTAMGWEIEPAGLTRLLVDLQARYTGPADVALVVTENGAAFDDTVEQAGDGAARVHDRDRVAYLRDHLAAVADAIDAGARVDGYFYWSLLDNFEWGWGYSQRFGIVHVDYPTGTRTVKDSGLAYRKIIAARALPGE